MFPIHSETGKVIGFGARALAEGDEPKYLNSGDSDVYQKRSVLYNLNRARKPIQEAGFSILVEGYMDVIGVYAAGVRNVVASCGTALKRVRTTRRTNTWPMPSPPRSVNAAIAVPSADAEMSGSVTSRVPRRARRRA